MDLMWSWSHLGWVGRDAFATWFTVKVSAVLAQLAKVSQPNEARVGLLQVSLHGWHRFHTKRKLLLLSREAHWEVTVNYYLSLSLQYNQLRFQRSPENVVSTTHPPLCPPLPQKNTNANDLAWFWERSIEALAQNNEGLKIDFFNLN